MWLVFILRYDNNLGENINVQSIYFHNLHSTALICILFTLICTQSHSICTHFKTYSFALPHIHLCSTKFIDIELTFLIFSHQQIDIKFSCRFTHSHSFALNCT